MAEEFKIQPRSPQLNFIPAGLEPLKESEGFQIDDIPATNEKPVNEPVNWDDIGSVNKPVDKATRNQVFAQNSAPTKDYKEGDIWFDTDDNNTIYRANSALSWVSVKDGSIAGKVTTFRQAAIPTALAAGDIWYDSDDAEKMYRATNAGDDQITAGEWVRVDPAWANIQDPATTKPENSATVGAKAGTNLKKSDNTTLGDADVVTSLGTAAAIASQGALATKNAVDLSTTEVTNKSLANVDATANTKLTGIETGATVGAKAGTNLKDSGSTVLTDQDIINIKTMTAGETINGATLPVPVYQNTTDNEVYACDGNVTTKLKFIGFAISNSTDGVAITVQLTGKVGGFTGLDEGLNYFVQDAVGTIGTGQGTYPVLVGRATSTTELKIISEADEGINTEFIASDNLKASADTERSTTETVYTKIKEITIKKAGTIRTKFDLASSTGEAIAYGRIYVNGVAAGTERSEATTVYANFSEDISGLNADDEVQLYKYGSGGQGTKCRNFRLYWDKITVKDYVVVTD